jgi:choline dehydrogenase-like flavoprotein
MRLLSDDFARAGLRPFHTPLGVMLDENSPHRSKCIRCNTCDGYPCLVYAKSDAQVVSVDPALAHPNVTLLTNSYVSRLETSPSGREVTSVLVERGGSKETYAADIVNKLQSVMKQQTRCPIHGLECYQGLFARNLFLGQRIPLAGVAHQNGTIRFGLDPRTSALDTHCKAHDLDNLYVVDGSFFPSSGAVNPALTIMANALRLGDHLLDQLG